MRNMAKPEPIHYPKEVRGTNLFTVDRNLERFLIRVAPGMLMRQQKTLEALGEFAGDRLDRQAEISDQSFPPALYDRPDDPTKTVARKKEVRLNPEYEDCQQELYRRGLVAKCFDGNNPESHILPFVAQYLVSQSDISTGCPFAMTHPVAFVLNQIAPREVKDKFLPEILRTDGKTAVCGTWATERHSGSDVGGTVTKAEDKDQAFNKAALAGKAESFLRRLNGHNWFTSAFGFKKFIAIKTARPSGAKDGAKGLGLYLVPSHVDDKWSVPNSYEITHLKRKLGTKGLPTVEVELKDTVGYEIAPEGQGINAMMTALGCSRVHNAMAAAGVMHRAFLEAMSWLENRETFGRKLIEREMLQKRVLDINTERLAGSALAFEAARSFDETTGDPNHAPWMRIATALAKYKTGEQAVWCAEKALEVVGGNGYTEDYPVARLYRDAMVLRVWEGPEQIQALELMRMIAGKEPGDNLFIEKIRAIAGKLPESMEAQKSRLVHLSHTTRSSLQELRANPQKAELVADEFLHRMADVLAYALLCEEACWELRHENDKTKLLVADHYYSRAFDKTRQPSFEKTPLHRHFNEVVRGLPVVADPARSNINRPQPKPGDWI